MLKPRIHFCVFAPERLVEELEVLERIPPVHGHKAKRIRCITQERRPAKSFRVLEQVGPLPRRAIGRNERIHIAFLHGELPDDRIHALSIRQTLGCAKLEA